MFDNWKDKFLEYCNSKWEKVKNFFTYILNSCWGDRKVPKEENLGKEGSKQESLNQEDPGQKGPRQEDPRQKGPRQEDPRQKGPRQEDPGQKGLGQKPSSTPASEPGLPESAIPTAPAPAKAEASLGPAPAPAKAEASLGPAPAPAKAEASLGPAPAPAKAEASLGSAPAPAPANSILTATGEEIVLAKPENQNTSSLLNIKLVQIKNSRDGFIKHIKEMKEDKLAKASKELIDCLFGKDFLKEEIYKEDLRFSGIFHQEGGGFFIKNYDIVKENIGNLLRAVPSGEDNICKEIEYSIEVFLTKKEDRDLEIKKEDGGPFDLTVFNYTSILLNALLQKLDEKQRAKGFENMVAGRVGARR